MQKLVIRKSELSSMNFLNAETIEKARKGEQASGHKYIWRKPKAKGGYDYIYAEDQVKRPLEMLVKWFSFTKDKISALYKKNNIEKDFKATENDFSAHLLEYIVHRNKWDKKFADKGEQQKFNKKVTMEQIKEVEKTGLKNPVTEGTPTEEKKQPGKPEKPLFKPNTYLMRKIWSMYTGKNLEEEKKVQDKAESEFIAVQAETVEEEKPVSEDVKNEADTLVRVAINTNMMIENRYKADKSEKTDDKIKSLKKLKSQIVQNEKRKAKRIEELRNYNAWNDSGLGFYDGSFIKKEDVEREIKEFDDKNAVIDWNTETINIIDKEIENLKNETKESEQEKHDNRSAAMLGNDNAKKDFSNMTNEELAETIEQTEKKIEDYKGYRDAAENRAKYGDNSLESIERRNSDKEEARKDQEIIDNEKESLRALRKEKENRKKQMFEEFQNRIKAEEDFKKQEFKGQKLTGENEKYQKEYDILVNRYTHLDTVGEIVEHIGRNLDSVIDGYQDPSAMASVQGLRNKEIPYNLILAAWFEALKNRVDINNSQDIEDYTALLNEASKVVDFSKLSLATLGNDNAKKDGIIPEGENNYGKDNSNTESDGIPGGISDLRRTGSTDSTGNVYITGNGSNEEQLSSSALQPGIGLKEPETTNIRSIGRIGDGSGKLTNGQAIKIRDACHKLLAEKTDSEMTADDKALLAQFVGAGGIKDKNNKRDNNGVLYEFYTPRAVVNKVWQLVDKYLPQKDKTCIEPSSGIGRFAENRTEKFTMFEFEEDSARIAKILHPDAEVVQGAFEKNFIRDGRFAGKNFQKFDCAVGNPPYGDYTGFYKGQGEGKEFARYDQYFVSRTLDTLKDNGILAFVMPSNFLSSSDPKFKKAKEIIASKGKLLEAWRLPNGVFQLDVKSGTNVGTDIIIIRKEKGDVNDFIGDNYFKNNPNHIAGDVVEQINFRGQPEKVVQPKNGEDFESAVNNIDINDVEAIIKELPKAETIIEEKPKVDAVTAHNNRSNAMKGNKNAAGKHNFVASTGKNMTATEFNQKYGKNIDPKEMEIWRFTDYAGNIDITKLTEQQKDYIEKSDRYVKDGQKIVNVVNYASGNIREKLDDLEIQLKSNEITEEDYNKKKLILETVLPPTKEIGQFQLSPLADWTRKYVTKDGMSLIQGFYDWVFNGNPDLSERELPIDSPVEEERIPPEISFGDVIDYIEKKPLTVGRGEADNAKDKAKLRYRKSEKRRDTAEMLFNEYLKEGLSPEDKEDLTKAWNDNFNSFVNPNYEQIPIFIDGMNENMGTTPFTLTEQQLKGISFLVNKGSGLLAYDVGVGKTVTGLCATVNQIQTGRSKRPLICVPNSVYENWIAEIHQHFPDLKVNELRNFGKDYISKDWKPEEGSLSICTYEALQKITFHDDTLDEIHEDVEFAKLQQSSGKESERQAAKKSEKLKELVGSMSKTSGDDSVYFEDLGFDHITVDEVHNFKNIFYVPRNMNVNVAEDTVTRESNEFNALQGSRSDRGEKLFAITQYIQRHNDNRNVFGLSATPFQNSPIEIYNILSLFARQRMKELSIYSLEEFVKQFALLKSEYAVKANTIEEKMVMKSFKNLAALQNLITEYIDKVDGGEAHVIRPKKQVHLPKLEMTELQRQIMDAESAYITQQSLLPKKDRDPGAILASLNAMRMATLSPALVHEGRYEIYQSLGYDIEKPKDKDVVTSSPKLQFVCDSVIKQYKAAPKEGQVIYMPRGVTQYKYVVDYLVKNGVPADAIATMAGGNGEKALIERENKTHEFNDVNGKCKIIIGSESIKEGVNLNGNSTTLYNTMLGWNPSETTQVEGRIWRQGNKQGITHIVYPLLNDSIDPMMYQKYDEKKNRIDNLFSYKGDTMNVEEINPEELKFGLIKDPKKRADVQTRQYKEQSESEYKMYNKLIEVLERQGQIAFNDPTQTKEYKDIQFNIDKDQKLYDVYKTGRKQWEDKYNSGDANTKAMAAKQMETTDKFLTAQKKKIDAEKRSLKKLENSRNNMLDTLKRKGIKDMADLEKKVGEYQKLAIIASNNMDNAAEMFGTYYKQAVEDNEKNKINLLPLKDQVEAYTKEIRDNLHPMDEAWKAMLREENEKQFKKSIPLFLIKGGRFLIRK